MGVGRQGVAGRWTVGISFIRQPLSLFAVIEQIRMNPLQLHNNSNVNPTVVWG